jgi:hypothetical protein
VLQQVHRARLMRMTTAEMTGGSERAVVYAQPV